jgi:hypothetical protein
VNNRQKEHGMNKPSPARRTRRPKFSELDELIEEITVDAYGEAEQLWAFHQAFEEEIPVPSGAFVIGEPVSVQAFDFDGNERRGLVAKCLRPDGRKYVVAASDVVFPPGSEGARYVASYRKWMGLPPFPPEATNPSPGKLRRETPSLATASKHLVELAVLSVKGQAVTCRFVGSAREVTLRNRRLQVPGEIVQVKLPQGRILDHPHLSAEIRATRIDARSLGLTPLRLEDRGIWNPIKQYWGEQGEPIERWAKPIVARGPRPAFEMEQVLPGYDYTDPEGDPIGVSNDLNNSGDPKGAYEVLMELCQADLRCLDAHAHLGNLAFDRSPQVAVRHYEVGFRIGELSLPEAFDGVLPWGHIDNRPFLRCMHGFGLCLWRLGDFAEASRIFDHMLWLNPSDNQGIRLLIDDIRAKRSWKDTQDY